MTEWALKELRLKTNILILMVYENIGIGSHVGDCNRKHLSNIGCIEDLEGYLSDIDKADFDLSHIGENSISRIGNYF